MFKIEAIIRPQRLEAVQEALYESDILGLTTTEVRGTGRQRGITHTFRGSQYANNLAPRVKVEVVVPDETLDAAIEAIQTGAFTGEVGDGKIFVSEMHEVIRIRTGERGSSAVS
jgi:nitrogen regulatory protein P-II 1